MITSSDEYLQQLSYIEDQAGSPELVMLPRKEPRFIIDANTRQITIPDTFKFLGVKGDHAAETIYFEIARYFDQHDLSEETCIIQYSSISSTGLEYGSGFYTVTKMDVDTVPDKIIFGWEIRNNITAYASTVRFSVRFYSLDSTSPVTGQRFFRYSLNTLESELPILDTLDTIGAMPDPEPNQVTDLTKQFDNAVKSVNESTSYARFAAASAQEQSNNAAKSAKEAKAAADVVGYGMTQEAKGMILNMFKTLAQSIPDMRISYSFLEDEWNKFVTEKIPAASIVLDKTETTVAVNGTDTLTPTILPSATTNQTVIWYTNAPKVATVENGVITGVSAGSAVIVAQIDNMVAFCNVTVTE